MIEVVIGDITTLNVDVIVNAANSSLLGGGGVDGAIHQAGGTEILKACQEIRENELPNGLPTGEAVATTAGLLPAKWVIHTVGPIYGFDENQETLLANAYRNSLELALQLGVKTIAFPSISTGVYGYPVSEASQIAVKVMRKFEDKFESIIICAFNEPVAIAFENALKEF